MLDPEMFKLPEPIGGTSDAGGVNLMEGILEVTDLKFGRGVLVEAEDKHWGRVKVLKTVADRLEEELG